MYLPIPPEEDEVAPLTVGDYAKLFEVNLAEARVFSAAAKSATKGRALTSPVAKKAKKAEITAGGEDGSSSSEEDSDDSENVDSDVAQADEET